MALLISIPLASLAQEVAQGDLELCAGMETAELKLACFEALTAIGSGKHKISTATRADINTVQMPDPGDPAFIDPVTVATTDLPLPEQPAADQQAAGAVQSSDPTGSESREEPDTYAEFGSEHLSDAAGQQGDRNLPAVMTVVEVTEGRYDVLFFHMANGQVWRQIQGRRFRYPKEGDFDVTISKGMMGDDQLRVEGSGAMTRIRRIR